MLTADVGGHKEECMKRLPRLSALVGLVALGGLVLLAPLPMLAAPPVQESFTWDLGAGPLGGDCGGVPILVDTTLYGTQTTYYDKDGNLSRITLHAKTQDRIYLEGSDRVLVGHANYHVFTLTPGAGLYEGVERFTGVFWHVIVPGLGTVLVDVGLEIIDWKLLSEGYSPVLKAVGKHQWLEGDFDTLCTALE
jgi:hypothetical protein